MGSQFEGVPLQHTPSQASTRVIGEQTVDRRLSGAHRSALYQTHLLATVSDTRCSPQTHTSSPRWAHLLQLRSLRRQHCAARVNSRPCWVRWRGRSRLLLRPLQEQLRGCGGSVGELRGREERVAVPVLRAHRRRAALVPRRVQPREVWPGSACTLRRGMVLPAHVCERRMRPASCRLEVKLQVRAGWSLVAAASFRRRPPGAESFLTLRVAAFRSSSLS